MAAPRPSRILCVEDDADSREMLRAVFEAVGYEVVTASEPAEALAMAERGGLALIILDNWYDKEDGVELCRRIRAFDTHTPVVFYSGVGQASDVEAGIAAGANAYALKPEIEILLQEVARLVGRNASGE